MAEIYKQSAPDYNKARLTFLRVVNENGELSDQIPVAVESEYIYLKNGENIESFLAGQQTEYRATKEQVDAMFTANRQAPDNVR